MQNAVSINFVLSVSQQQKMKKTFPLTAFSYNNLSEYETCKSYYVCNVELTGLGLCKNRMIISLSCLTLLGQ